MNKDDLITYTELFIKCSSQEYIPSPQVYSPLYIRLYNALINKGDPELLGTCDINSLPESTLEDINNHSTNSFDRYLMANYMSPFELSYPLPIPNKELTHQRLNEYLCFKYNKDSKEPDSFKYDRAFKDVLSLFPVRHRDVFGAKKGGEYRSSFFKLITLNYKLSRVNEKWKDHARRASFSDKTHFHLDTIIAFNGLDNKLSRQASATFMTLYYELDQSSPDGDHQFSRHIVMITSAFILIDMAIRNSIVKKWCEGFDSEERSEETENHIKQLIRNNIKKVDYEDPHHHFCDVLRAAILCNSHYNKLLAKLEFESVIFNNAECAQVFHSLLQDISWYSKSIRKEDLTSRIIELFPNIRLPLTKNIFEEKIWSIAKHLQPILIDRIPNLSESSAKNLSTLFVILCYKKFPRIRGSLKGANRPYSLWKSLKDGHSKINNESISLWEHESVYPPSLLHMMELVSLFVIWKSEKTINRFEQFVMLRKEILESQIRVNTNLDGEHHNCVINVANSLAQQNNYEIDILPEGSVFENFWRKTDPKIKSFSKHIGEHLKRKSLRWPSGPINTINIKK